MFQFWDLRQAPPANALATVQLPERVYCADVVDNPTFNTIFFWRYSCFFNSHEGRPNLTPGSLFFEGATFNILYSPVIFERHQVSSGIVQRFVKTQGYMCISFMTLVEDMSYLFRFIQWPQSV